MRAFAGTMMTRLPQESREITVSRGKQKIKMVANSLNLTSHHVQSAQRLFNLAIQHKYVFIFFFIISATAHISRASNILKNK